MKEEQVAQDQKRLLSLGQIASVIAHELRSPITGIINLTELLLTHTGFPPEKIKQYLELIHKGALECNQMIQNISKFAKEMQHYEKEPIEINQQLEEWKEFIQESVINTSSIRIEYNPSPDPLYIQMDKTMLKEVFTNLLLNAIQALKGRPDGKIVISTQKEDKWVIISFEDNGPGIPQDKLEYIFRPFYSTRKTGVGLGLTIVREIVEKHGGKIKIESVENKGSKFIIWLPIKE